MLKINQNLFMQIVKISAAISLLGFISCNKPNQSGEKSEPPAKVTNAVEESELSTIKLTLQAENRLGIEIFSVEKRELPGHLNVGGEIVSPPGC